MIKAFDEKRELAIYDDLVEFACSYFIDIAKSSIKETGKFSVALSGGSTPKALYNKLKDHKADLDWSKVFVFFSDERSAGPEDPDSNYHMARENGFADLPIPPEQLFRMIAESNMEENAKKYESLIREHLDNQSFDLILLGMGDDGHTASLFPNTDALKETKDLVVKNHVPQKNTDRMTFTYPLIEKAKHVLFLATGESKAAMVSSVLNDTEGKYPAGKVTCNNRKVLWGLDTAASSKL